MVVFALLLLAFSFITKGEAFTTKRQDKTRPVLSKSNDNNKEPSPAHPTPQVTRSGNTAGTPYYQH
jgi:hypothetical protein